MILPQQLIAVRETAKALIAVIDAALTPPKVPEACAHPEASRVSVSTMGNAGAFTCRACGATVRGDPAAPAQEE